MHVRGANHLAGRPGGQAGGLAGWRAGTAENSTGLRVQQQHGTKGATITMESDRIGSDQTRGGRPEGEGGGQAGMDCVSLVVQHSMCRQSSEGKRMKRFLSTLANCNMESEGRRNRRASRSFRFPMQPPSIVCVSARHMGVDCGIDTVPTIPVPPNRILARDMTIE